MIGWGISLGILVWGIYVLAVLRDLQQQRRMAALIRQHLAEYAAWQAQGGHPTVQGLWVLPGRKERES